MRYTPPKPKKTKSLGVSNPQEAMIKRVPIRKRPPSPKGVNNDFVNAVRERLAIKPK